MTFETEDRAALRESVRNLLAKHSDSSAVRKAITAPEGYDAGLWERMVEQIGVAALAVPEDYDGVGASLAETHVVLEELGRTLTPSPMLGSTVLAAQALLLSGDTEACARLLPGIAAGEIAAVCWASGAGWSSPGVTATGDRLDGTAHYVLGGDVASTLLVLARDGDAVALFEVDPHATGVTRRRVPTMDPTRSLAQVRFDGVTGRPLACPADLVDRLRTVALIALSAEQVGAAQAALDLTVEYTKNRKQFGRVIGSFQALKHRMADMYALVETARSMSYAAALSQDTQDAYAAKVYCSEAFEQVAAETIQLHGGIAITWEHDAQLYFKRAHGTAQLFGQPREFLAAIGM
ncbi:MULTISPECIES: acyl-CoA dehydrogenase family protein [Rhodococcus]|uniref:acyl-CoA dehydrogenase family protein n=1 Tax=Rhodococcus TaxID=1827 RepID=UPI000C9CF272|nr:MULTISPECIES: acyl-CoA dehydrogenase family protein [Rhodococcus]MDV6295665.1 acyl-CoA dehydrogenase family protein [Rhodococcus aetherivorans]PND49502.1 acyl-CoA dehydrogenase [Rhodococcus sp. ENV425]WKW99488.1 acyl-CoA dehydrogenase family protein [Rhodococcus aetherivorans]